MLSEISRGLTRHKTKLDTTPHTGEKEILLVCVGMQNSHWQDNKITLVWIPGHQGLPGNEETDRLAKEEDTRVPLGQITDIPFSVHKKLIKTYLEFEHQARWDACTGCCQPKTLMRYHLPSAANKLLTMSRMRLGVAAGLLTGQKTLQTHMYKLRLTEQQDC